MHQHGEHCNHDHEQQQAQQANAKQKALDLLKKKYMPLYKFLKDNGMKFKSAAVDKHAVEYFRVDQFLQFLEVKKDIIQKNAEISQMLKSWQKIFIFYKRVENMPHLKWPQQLQKTKDKKHKDTKFAGFNFDTSTSSGWLTILIFFVIIAVVLFPLWPYEVKYFLWLVSYYLFVSIIGLLILRVFLYLLVSMFGGSFWVFPKLLQNVEFKDTFIPLYSLSWWQGSNFYNALTRLLVLAIFCYYGHQIYNDPDIVKSNIKITKTLMDDLNQWGVSKIKGEKNFSQSALTDYAKMYNQTNNEDKAPLEQKEQKVQGQQKGQEGGHRQNWQEGQQQL